MMRTPTWFIPAVMALILWGVWGVLQKLATNHMPPRNVYLVSALGAIAVVLVIVSTSKFPLQMSAEGTFFAVIAGICSALGGMMFLQAVSRGEASVVITFTALYPVVSIILSFALFRDITLKGLHRHGLSMLLAG
jgi:transporter family protein